MREKGRGGEEKGRFVVDVMVNTCSVTSDVCGLFVWCCGCGCHA